MIYKKLHISIVLFISVYGFAINGMELVTQLTKDAAATIKPKQALGILLKTLEGDDVSLHDVSKALNIEKLSEKLEIDPDVVQAIVANIAKKQPQKSKLTTLIEKLPPQVVDQLRGGVIGSGALLISWLIGHAICHPVMEFFEPQTFWTAGALALGASAFLYKAVKSIKARNSIQNLVLNMALPFTSLAASHLYENLMGDQDKSKKTAAEEEDEMAMPEHSFGDFAESLSQEQMELLPVPNILLIAQHRPKILLAHSDFINGLSNEQLQLLEPLLK